MGIEWKEGVVCFGNSRQWGVECIDLFNAIGGIGAFDDFQLNEIREGDYISVTDFKGDFEEDITALAFLNIASSFGFNWRCDEVSFYEYLKQRASSDFVFLTSEYGVFFVGKDCLDEYCESGRLLTLKQVSEIGKLKRAMIERDEAPLDVSGFNTVEPSREKRARRNKSKQAYEILKSLDYEYDLVKQQWYKKQYV